MVVDYHKRIRSLEAKFSGVTNPQEMGTTGLVAWVVIASGVKLWTRYRQARKVIRERLGARAVEGFTKACLAEAPCEWRRERIQNYAKK